MKKSVAGFTRTSAAGVILSAASTTFFTQGRATTLPLRTRVVQSLSSVVLSSTCALCLVTLTRTVTASPAGEPAGLVNERVQLVVDRLRSELGIPESVSVTIEPQVALVVSVEAPRDRDEPFRLAIEHGFLDALSAEELDAVLAHELGHVWVFTHHPYLQTEKLANQIALRVVTRDSLVAVYQKLWQHGGTRGDLESYLDPVN
jgi:Zn-dependent protease with chaperone function